MLCSIQGVETKKCIQYTIYNVWYSKKTDKFSTLLSLRSIKYVPNNKTHNRETLPSRNLVIKLATTYI